MTPTNPAPSSLDATATRLLWREQARALPRALLHAVRRILRMEPRLYLTDGEGRVLARFTSDVDHQQFVRWVAESHEGTFDYGFAVGKEYLVAKHLSNQAHAGEPGPA